MLICVFIKLDIKLGLKVLTLKVPKMQIAESANSIDLDEVAQNEPPHLDLHCCPLVFEISI